MTRLAPRVLCSRAVSVGNAAHAVGPWTPGRADVARPGLFVDRSYVPCAASATGAAISGAVSTRPQRRRRRWAGFKEVELLPSRDALRA